MSEREVHYAAGGGNGDARNCRFCGEPLTPERVGTGTCGSLECHDRMIEESGLAIIARKRAKHEAVTEEVFAATADEIGKARAGLGSDALAWMIPAQHEPLAALPPERLAKFREHLEFCATMAFREPEPDPDGDLSAREKHEPDEAPLAGAACATCRGRCCKDRGGDTALLLPNDFARYRQRNPGVSRDAAIEAYLSHLPALSTRDGCVYQAETGCALPRAMRQDICNSYYCDALRWLRMASDEAGVTEAVLVAADKGSAERVAAVGTDGALTIVADFVEDET